MFNEGEFVDMRMVDIIIKKREGGHLSKEEIDFFIEGYVKGEIPDYQASALLMTIVYKGMESDEIANLTKAMIDSGDVCDLSSISGIKVDKHSTGGVGDKTSLVLGPLVASCGAKLAKMSGRGLGHTGGTLDKLESIPGFNIALTTEQFLNQVKDIGMSIIGQTSNLVPADKKLYALRDVTGTVDSIPLIAASIMSKKIASGSDTILLDVKFGEGAFMKNIEDARRLAETMVAIGKAFNRNTIAEITNMNEPLGKAVGNNLEVKEAALTLLGQGPKDLTELCLDSGATMLLQANLANSREEATEMLKNNLANGEAFEVFVKFVKAQGGDESYIRDLAKFPIARYTSEIVSSRAGYISRIGALEIGVAAMKLGAGREKKEDRIDMSAGIVLNKKVGDYVKKGEVLATLYTERPNFESISKEIIEAIEITDESVDVGPIIIERIGE